uniref:F-box associated beta-propeller type 1 domain-containing protein n=1 Tax=Quercus lobata TaxID=97700 RepID=A0A7N2LG67_QUELO
MSCLAPDPAIHPIASAKSWLLPILPSSTKSSLDTLKGFAYHYQNNDYKVVRISQPSSIPIPPSEVEVYSLNSDSWKRVALGISWRSNNMHYKINCEMSFPFVSGHSHWMLDMRQGGGQQEKLSQIILSFDVNNEKFREQPLPDDGSFSAEVYIHFIDFMKYSLLLIQKNYQGKEVHIEPKTLHEEEIGFPIKLSLDIATCLENLTLLDGANVVSY